MQDIGSSNSELLAFKVLKKLLDFHVHSLSYSPDYEESWAINSSLKMTVICCI